MTEATDRRKKALYEQDHMNDSLTPVRYSRASRHYYMFPEVVDTVRVWSDIFRMRGQDILTEAPSLYAPF